MAGLKAEIGEQQTERRQLRKMLTNERKKLAELSQPDGLAERPGAHEQAVVFAPAGRLILPDHTDGVVNLPTRSQSIPFVQTIPRSTGARHLLPTQEGSQPKLAIVDCGHQVPTQPE